MTDDAKEDAEMVDFIKTWTEQHEARMKAKFAKLKTEVVPPLRSLGVAIATLDYDGYGDSSSDETLTLADADGKRISTSGLAALGLAVEGEMIDLMSAVVPDGYENNEGGFGQVILDVAAGTIRNEHSQRVEQIEYIEEEYEI